MTSAKAAAFYKIPASLELTQQTIDAKLLAVLEDFEADLRAEFPHYDTFPDAIKMALLDMIYNLGPQVSSKASLTSSPPSKPATGHRPPSTARAADPHRPATTGRDSSFSASSAPSKQKPKPG